MKSFVDNELLKYLVTSSEVHFLEFQKTCGSYFSNSKFHLPWNSLLEYLEISNLFESLPIFNDQNRLYIAIIKTLETELDKSLIIEMYDKLFAECLREVQTLSEITASNILQLIEAKQRSMSIPEHLLVGPQLNHYGEILTQQPQAALHDLILNLAWDRMSVYLATIFENPNSTEPYLKGIQTLKECLIESFIHIDRQGKSKISFFRLMEAIYAFEMRPERLDLHSEEDWQLLSKCGQALRSRNIPVSIYYVDYALYPGLEKPAKIDLKAFTMDTDEVVTAILLLANYVVKKLKTEEPSFEYVIGATEIIKMNTTDKGLVINSILDTL